MYNIEKTNFGFDLLFADLITENEMTDWVNDSKEALKTAKPPFGVFVDMRTLGVLEPGAQENMLEGQKLYKGAGMARSVVILNSATLTIQFKRLAQESGIYEWERYINADSEPNWRQIGVQWIEHAIDPDK